MSSNIRLVDTLFRWAHTAYRYCHYYPLSFLPSSEPRTETLASLLHVKLISLVSQGDNLSLFSLHVLYFLIGPIPRFPMPHWHDIASQAAIDAAGGGEKMQDAEAVKFTKNIHFILAIVPREESLPVYLLSFGLRL